jgi:hypothetical protein
MRTITTGHGSARTSGGSINVPFRIFFETLQIIYAFRREFKALEDSNLSNRTDGNPQLAQRTPHYDATQFLRTLFEPMSSIIMLSLIVFCISCYIDPKSSFILNFRRRYRLADLFQGTHAVRICEMARRL